jgi:hypothetical protein
MKGFFPFITSYHEWGKRGQAPFPAHLLAKPE